MTGYAQNRRQRRNRKGLIIATLANIALFIFLFQAALQAIKHNYGEQVQPALSHGVPGKPAFLYSQMGAAEPIALDLLGRLNSSNAILVDLATGKTLAQYNHQQRIYPASLTKIMTALLVIEYSLDLEQEVELPQDIYQTLYEQDAALAGFEPGERAKLRDLLYGILLPSGAESSLALANKISGSESAFVDLMNQKAQALGMVHTHFSNATGLHAEDHYATVEDLSLLLRYALQNETFRTVFTSSRYTVQPTNRHPHGFTFRSTMFRYMESADISGGEILGGKTGYTEEAGQCLASLARINGREYILVTVGANGSPLGKQRHILDAVDVYSRIAIWNRVR